MAETLARVHTHTHTHTHTISLVINKNEKIMNKNAAI